MGRTSACSINLFSDLCCARLKKMNKIAEVESNLVLDARLNGACKIKRVS